MYKMLIKLFVKNSEEIHLPKVRMRYGFFCSTIGFLTNLLLASIKIIIGFLAGSISILADGIDNLTDCASSVTTFIAFRLANQPADSKHPFGHERIEYVCGIIVSIFIIIIGVFLGKSSIEKIITKEIVDLTYFSLLIIILVSSILIKLWQYGLYRFAEKTINSPTIYAAAQDSLNDTIKTLVVLISVLLFKFFKWNVDGWFGLIVSFYIIFNGIILVKKTSSPLIGEAPNKNYTKKITDKILSYDGVLGLHDLMIHNYGPGKTFITVHVEVDCEISILENHDVIDKIERDFQNEGLLLTIHMDPLETKNERTNVLKSEVEQILKKISPKLQFHDFRIVSGLTSLNILFDIVLPNDLKMDDELLINNVINQIKKIIEPKVGYLVNVIINIDRNYI